MLFEGFLGSILQLLGIAFVVLMLSAMGNGDSKKPARKRVKKTDQGVA